MCCFGRAVSSTLDEILNALPAVFFFFPPQGTGHQPTFYDLYSYHSVHTPQMSELFFSKYLFTVTFGYFIGTF